jgi:hypothetical protein
MSFGAIPEPFGIELVFDNQSMKVERTELPEAYGDSKLEKALRAMQDQLEANKGLVIHRQDLLDIGVKAANASEGTVKKALTELEQRLGDELVKVKLSGQGSPVGYCYGQLEPETLTDQNPKEVETPSETEESFGHYPLTKTDPMPQTFEGEL